MFDKIKIMQKELHIALLRDNFIQKKKYSYEQYLVDFLNNSRLKSDTGNTDFIHCEEQNDGQDDAYNENYQLDFKIFTDANQMKGKRNYTQGIVCIGKGVTAYTRAKKQEGTIKYYNLLGLIMGKDKNFWKNIMSEQDEMYEPLKAYMNKIEMNKNLLFFLPHQYYLRDMDTTYESGKFIAERIADEFKSMVAYRKDKVEKDTYIGFVSNKKFILIKEINGQLVYYDMVDTRCSELYHELIDLSKTN